MADARVTAQVAALLLTAVPLVRSAPVDRELERLKAAASEASAKLVVRESVVRKRDREVDQTQFLIDTGARQYTMRYKTFRGDDARHNANDLNDWSSGYGMVAPHQNWYHNGFVQVDLSGTEGTNIRFMEGKPRVLVEAGRRIAYDLVFADPVGTVVVRTVAMGGREELFLSVSGRLTAGEEGLLRTTFCGYPLGFTPPFDRWVHADGQDIRNAGKQREQFALDLQALPWLLLADHTLDPGGSKQGLLGLVYDKDALTQAAVLHNRNYAILPVFTGPVTREQRYIVHTFGPLAWEEARTRLSRTGPAAQMLDRAFRGLPSPFGE